MSDLRPPVYDFDHLKPVTMTIIASYEVEELNLPAIFTFLPVTDKVLPANLNVQKKQGKIRLPPELNVPGEILSMRYDKQVRGIMRSENAKSFSHSIIIDMGTSERIISVKLSRKLEFTGPTSIDIAKEAAENLIACVKRCEEDLIFVRKHHERSLIVKEKYLLGKSLTPEDDPEDHRIWRIFEEKSRGFAYENMEAFLDFIINFNRNLYTGSLKLHQFECEMANILFNLGFPINQQPFVNALNHYPFRCKFNNFKSASSVAVYYDYTKYERSTGQPKQAKHTIRVNRSGHVRHSGPNLESMEAVYYAFMQRILQHFHEIQSVENKKKQIRIDGPGKSLSVKEWRTVIREEEKLRQRVLDGEVPIALGEPTPESVTTSHRSESLLEDDSPINQPIADYQPSLQENLIDDTFSFDYTPLVIK